MAYEGYWDEIGNIESENIPESVVLATWETGDVDVVRALGPQALLSDRLVACVCVYFRVSGTIAYSAGFSDAFSRGDVRCVASEGGLASRTSFSFTNSRTTSRS